MQCMTTAFLPFKNDLLILGEQYYCVFLFCHSNDEVESRHHDSPAWNKKTELHLCLLLSTGFWPSAARLITATALYQRHSHSHKQKFTLV